MHACCKKAAISQKLNPQKLSKGISAKIYILENNTRYTVYRPLLVGGNLLGQEFSYTTFYSAIYGRTDVNALTTQDL